MNEQREADEFVVFVPAFDIPDMNMCDPANAAPAAPAPATRQCTLASNDGFVVAITPPWSGDKPRVFGWVDHYRDYRRVDATLRPGETIRLQWRNIYWGPDGHADVVAERDFSYDDAVALMQTAAKSADSEFGESMAATVRDGKVWRIPRP